MSQGRNTNHETVDKPEKSSSKVQIAILRWIPDSSCISLPLQIKTANHGESHIPGAIMLANHLGTDY